MKQPTVFSIGYTAFPMEQLIAILKRYQVDCVIDVRSVPYSRLHPEYDQEPFSVRLRRESLFYRHRAAEFGARQTNPDFYQSVDLAGRLDFRQYTASEAFQRGVCRIRDGLRAGYSFALFCAEKDPIRCHRAIMVGYGLKKAGISVRHILSDGSVQSQEDLETRLLELHDRENLRSQISLIPEENVPTEIWIERCYRKQNALIGCRFDDAKTEEDR